MSERMRDIVVRLRHPRRLWDEWRRDHRGAAAVQFVAVLPLFLLLVLGFWALFQLYSAQQTLCEAVNRAQLYLQVEGPWFPEDVLYPDGWVPYATDIINSELRSNAMTPMQVGPQDIQFFPPDPRWPQPQDQSEIEFKVKDAWFQLRATAEISGSLGTLASLFDENHSGVVRLTCQSTGFYEWPPIKSTDNADPGATRVNCPPIPPKCTAGPPPTACVGPGCPTPDPCPCDP